MNSKGHLYMSLAKSVIRIGACIWSIAAGNATALVIGFLGAEVLGVAEELLDKR